MSLAIADVAVGTEPGAIEARGITKRFPGVLALDDVSFDVRRGEIHALLGENGAGKSTLIKILTGVYRQDEGEVLLDGQPVSLRSPHHAHMTGISLVPQDVLIVPELSIGRNILLGLEGLITRRVALTSSERSLVRDALDRIGADFDESVRAGSLSVPQLRLAQIARTLIKTGDVLVMDEPSAVLSESDAEAMLERVKGFRAAGKAIIYISHRLTEVMQIADRITVLRDGRRVGQFRRDEIDKERVIALMAKDDASAVELELPQSATTQAPHGATLLDVRGLRVPGRFHDVSFTAKEGQIVGIAGVQGSGHGHLLRAIAGADHPHEGSIEIAGQRIRGGSVKAAFSRGVMLVPADRRGAGIVGGLSVRANIALSSRMRTIARQAGARWHRQERKVAREYIDAFSIRVPGTEGLAGNLSGGNQQKVVVARALESDPKVLLVEEPTQGIDVHAKREIRALLERAARREGCCAVIASSEFEELLGFADVIHVMCLGRLVATLDGRHASYRDVLHHALP